MIVEHCPVRLFYENGRGVARLPGFERLLTKAPAIPGLPPIDMIDYVPLVVAMLRPLMWGQRDLEPHEIEIVRLWLHQQKGPC